MRTTTVDLPEALRLAVDAEAASLGISRSELIRRAIATYFDAKLGQNRSHLGAP